MYTWTGTLQLGARDLYHCVILMKDWSTCEPAMSRNPFLQGPWLISLLKLPMWGGPLKAPPSLLRLLVFPLEDRYCDIDHAIHAPSAASTIVKAFDRGRTLLKVAGLAKCFRHLCTHQAKIRIQ